MSLVKQVTNKPWERKGIIGPLRPEGAFPVAQEKVALGFFLMVVGVIFSLYRQLLHSNGVAGLDSAGRARAAVA